MNHVFFLLIPGFLSMQCLEKFVFLLKSDGAHIMWLANADERQRHNPEIASWRLSHLGGQMYKDRILRSLPNKVRMNDEIAPLVDDEAPRKQ